MAKQQFFTKKIAKSYTPLQRKLISKEVIDFIVKRTKKGLGINGKPWTGKAARYEPSYKESVNFKAAGKGGKVNLTLSRDMLSAIKDLKSSKGELKIGYDAGTKDNAKAEGNQLGTYGQKTPISGKARPFLDITQKDLKTILSKYPVRDKEKLDQTVQSRLTALGVAKDANNRVNLEELDDLF